MQIRKTGFALTALLGLVTALGAQAQTTVLKVGTSDLTPMFAAFAKHHAVSVVACRPRSGNRKGVVEKNNHTAAQRWWRNLPDDLTAEQAQHSLTQFATGQDGRRREGRDGSTTAAAMFAAERLAPLPPTLFPVVVVEDRLATRQALIDWRGNRYSVPPELAATKVVVHQRLGAATIDIATVSGVVLARHRIAEPGLGVTIRDEGVRWFV